MTVTEFVGAIILAGLVIFLIRRPRRRGLIRQWGADAVEQRDRLAAELTGRAPGADAEVVRWHDFPAVPKAEIVRLMFDRGFRYVDQDVLHPRWELRFRRGVDGVDRPPRIGEALAAELAQDGSTRRTLCLEPYATLPRDVVDAEIARAGWQVVGMQHRATTRLQLARPEADDMTEPVEQDTDDETDPVERDSDDTGTDVAAAGAHPVAAWSAERADGGWVPTGTPLTRPPRRHDRTMDDVDPLSGLTYRDRRVVNRWVIASFVALPVGVAGLRLADEGGHVWGTPAFVAFVIFFSIAMSKGNDAKRRLRERLRAEEHPPRQS